MQEILTINFIEIPADAYSLSLRKKLYSVGVNDAKYKTSTTINGKNLRCPYYLKWKDMMKRCYSKKFQEAFPTYKGCTVCDEWHLFSNFRLWMKSMKWEGNHLDKDLLSGDKKTYSPSTCIFIPPSINYITLSCTRARGPLKQGVTFDKRKMKYMSCCRVFSGKRKFIGYYLNPQDAHEAYKKFKYEHIKIVAMEFDEPIRSALVNYRIDGDRNDR